MTLENKQVGTSILAAKYNRTYLQNMFQNVAVLLIFIVVESVFQQTCRTYRLPRKCFPGNFMKILKHLWMAASEKFEEQNTGKFLVVKLK